MVEEGSLVWETPFVVEDVLGEDGEHGIGVVLWSFVEGEDAFGVQEADGVVEAKGVKAKSLGDGGCV